MIDSKLFMDSSAWLNYLLLPASSISSMVDSDDNMIFTSAITFHEVHRRLCSLGKSESEVSKAVDFIGSNSIVVPVSREIATASSKTSQRFGLATVDSIIYASAQQSNALLVTFDTDFQKIPKVKLLKK